MAEFDPLAALPPTRMPASGRYGAAGATPGTSLRALDTLAIATAAVRPAGAAAVEAAALSRLGLALPTRSGYVAGIGLGAVAVAPGRWLLLSDAEPGHSLATRLQDALGADASVTDQSDALAVFAFDGPDLLAALAKFVPLDLHPRVFAPGSAATTSLAGIGATLWRPGPEATILMAVARSYAVGFVQLALRSAAEFGVSFTGAATER